MLESIYEQLKTDFELRKETMLGVEETAPYTAPTELKTENVEEVITSTNDIIADAADNNVREEVHAGSRKANLLMSMARDSQSATRPRLEQVKNYLLYVDRALFEADPTDDNQSDGMLLAGIRRVDL